jgi:hypothetical protein
MMGKGTSREMNHPGEIVLYRTEDGMTRIECRFADANIWLTQALMAELFQATVPNINLHIKNILDEGEVPHGATVKDYLIVRSEGGAQSNTRIPIVALEGELACT